MALFQEVLNAVAFFPNFFFVVSYFNNFFFLLQSVASNGVIGSIDETPEECAACLKGSCRSISGLYTKPDLPPGYSLVAQIPQGACRIIVQQLKHTRNNIGIF